MLCSVCQRICFKRWADLSREDRTEILMHRMEYDYENEEENEYMLQDPDGEYAIFHFFVHSPSLKLLRQSADNGCQFCYQMLYGELENALQDKDDYGIVYLQLTTNSYSLAYDAKAKAPSIALHHGNHEGEMRLREGVENFVNSALLEHASGINSTTGSVTNLNLAAKWLHECKNHHEKCPREPHVQSALPLRVLDVGTLGNSSALSLSVGENRTGSYAVLSYCWGVVSQLPFYVSTDANIEARKQFIDPDILPKTFTDAISVCQHLGIPFLWIDSICIIQGNEHDWKTQSAQMGDIYSKALLTISAAKGTDSNSGLFVERDPRKTYPCPISFQHVIEEESAATFSRLTCRDLEDHKFGPLDSRGWTFQEMYLSTRTLRFSAKGMHWVCASQNASEGLPMGQQPFNHKSDFDDLLANASLSSSNSRYFKLSEKYSWWYLTVENYSRRCFTKETDRLIALSGLASILQERLQDDYIFGLWKGDFLQGLTWTVDSDAPILPQDKPSIFIAPSWSWASRPGKAISYCMSLCVLHSDSTVRGSRSPRTMIENPYHILHPLFEFLEGHPNHTNTTPYNSIPGTSLKIRGLVLRAYLRPMKDNTTGPIDVVRPISNIPFIYRGSPNFDESVNEKDELYCMPIAFLGPPDRWESGPEEDIGIPESWFPKKNRDRDPDLEKMIKHGLGDLPRVTWCGSNVDGIKLLDDVVLKCLVLKRTGKQMQFRRVGYAEIIDGHAFEDVQPAVMEIV